MSKPLISVCLAVFNEQKNLAKCLDSVSQLADEIIIVDGHSEDKTISIAKSFNARIFKTTNKPIFHQNKQLAIEKASGSWILQLDADEVVSPKLKQEIKSIIKSKTKYNGFYLPRKNWFLTRFLTKGGQYPDYVIRLFKNGYGRFPCQTVHEQISIKGPVGHLKNDLLHYSDPDFNHYLSKFNHYTDLDAQSLYQKKTKPGLLMAFKYLLFKPIHWFIKTYFRHLGFIDLLPGFIFSLMSSLRFPITYIKFWQKHYASGV